ncbi:DEAD/DEAH box helicase, partial [Klebsiella pneumoniae]|uniref:DEAD/DEAH box helicase n=1 Tax=Klebsiella pneumoniae TaxID=573 RepID=UPI00272FB7FF
MQAQASARAHRIGQQQPVFVYQLVAEGSIEERMLELQARKRALADGLLGHDDGSSLGKFSVPELHALLAPLGGEVDDAPGRLAV